ncbi:hypothetical protein HJC23_001888 [Cyclotella cryptica]|uniref:Kringle domain-containing protein n=1 Tax=Cyclotella cryptica TaxID=29204 RepID=A0ABD3PLX3_9STRA
METLQKEGQQSTSPGFGAIMRIKTLTFATLVVGFAGNALSATPTIRPTKRRKRSPSPTLNNSSQPARSSATVSVHSDANETVTPACAFADPEKCGCQEAAQADYRGAISVTENGYTCKEWTFFGAYNWPDHGLEYNNNCRNPNQANTRAWCFVMESNVIWDFCDVPYCDKDVKSEETGESSAVGDTSNSPSFKPSRKRTDYPTVEGTTKQPVTPKANPRTSRPHTVKPTYLKVLPSVQPSILPTTRPSNKPTDLPTTIPTTKPSNRPTKFPTVLPSLRPTTQFSDSPVERLEIFSKACPSANSYDCGCEEVRQADYRGSVSVTEGGYTCRVWSQNNIWPNQGLDDGPFCRNPNQIAAKAWCWVDDVDVIWDYCSVPICGAKNSGNSEISMDTGESSFANDAAAGTIRTVVPSPIPIHFSSLKPTLEPQMRTYEATEKLTSSPTALMIDKTQCGSYAVRQADYRGEISTTVDGDECQNWSDQWPHVHNYTPKNHPELKSNYCRNPDHSSHPWCYTTNPEKRWGWCDVPLCPENQEQSKGEKSNGVQIIKFVAFGDTPYAKNDRYCLNRQLRELNQQEMDFRFIVHIGDIKPGDETCDSERYSDVAEIISHPDNAIGYDIRNFFMLPGDNEWSDCIDKAQAWRYWMTYFGNGNFTEETGIGPNANGFGTLSDGTNVEYFNDPIEDGNYPSTSSNFAFYSDEVLFVGLNQVGGGIIGDEERRVYGNYLWVEQNMSKYYLKGMRAMVVFAHAAMTGVRHVYFGVPFMKLLRKQYPDIAVLYLHGDGHNFGVISPDPKNPNLMSLEVEGGEEADPLLISVLWDNTVDEYSFHVDYRNGKYESGCVAGNTDKTWSSNY